MAELKIGFRAERTAIAPIASFSVTPTSGSPPLIVSFTNTTTGEVDFYTWDFGDGDTFSGRNPPDHTYTVDGVYTVTLSIEGPGGSDSASHNVTVNTGGGGGAPYDNIVDAFPLIQDGLEHTKDFDNTGATMETNEEAVGEGFQGVWATFDLTDYPPGCVTITFQVNFISGTVVPFVDFWTVTDDTFDPAFPDFSKLDTFGYALSGDGDSFTATIDPDVGGSGDRTFYIWIGDDDFDSGQVGIQRLTYTIQAAPNEANPVLRADGRSGASACVRANFPAENEVWATASVAFSTCAGEAWRTDIFSASGDLLQINSGAGASFEEGISVHKDGTAAPDPIAWESAVDFDHAQVPAPTGEVWQLLELHWRADLYQLTAYVDATQIWTWDFGDDGPEITGVTVGLAGSQAASSNGFAYVDYVKVGTTREGMEIFSDDFSSGDLSNWDVTTGSVDVGPDPFP